MKKLLITSFYIIIFFAVYSQKPDFPIAFDLRDVNGENYVTSVKLQISGTCWAHGTMAAMESNLMINGNWFANGNTGESNLAEYHLDWWNGFNRFYNNDFYPEEVNGLEVHLGGDYLVSAAYLTRGDGAVREIDGQSFEEPPLYNSPNFQLFYPNQIEWFTMDSNLIGIDTIKSKLMQYGALGTAMKAFDYMYGIFHYQPLSDTIPPDHAVSIVGWNDTITTHAPLPGAWLCKNSWGEDFAMDGFFWISYYDKHCARYPEMGAVSFQDIKLYDFDYMYYHDYHGWRKTFTESNIALNVFKSNGDGILNYVSFYNESENVDYTIKIYKSFESGILDSLQSVKTGNILHKGFHTIELDSSVRLDVDHNFYIYFELNAGGQAYDCTSEIPLLLGAKTRTIVPSKSNAGESYYFLDEQWYDLFEYDSSANFCIKGLTLVDSILPSRAVIPEGPSGVCINNMNSTYTTNSINATNYEWQLSPDDVGVMYNYNNTLVIDWADEIFVEEAELKVRGINEFGIGAFSRTLKINIIQVEAPPLVDLPTDTTVCEGADIEFIFDYNTWHVFKWNNEEEFESDPILNPFSDGEYFLTIMDKDYKCISLSDTINITTLPSPSVNLGEDISITTNDTIILDAGSGFTSYEWNTGSLNQTIEIIGSELGHGSFSYYVTVTNEYECTDSDKIYVIVSFPQNTFEVRNFAENVYPNPIHPGEELIISAIPSIDEIEIFNHAGISKMLIIKPGNKITLHENIFSQGLYIVELRGKDFRYKLKLVVIN